MRQPKVALLSGYVLDSGGVETHLHQLLQHSNECQHWLIFAPTTSRFTSLLTQCRVRVVEWKPSHAFDVAAFVRLVRLSRSCDAGLLHIHSPNAALIGAAAGCVLGVPTVLTIHLPAYSLVSGQSLRAGIKRWLYQRAEQLAQYLATAVIYVSAEVCRETRALGVVPSGARHSESPPSVRNGRLPALGKARFAGFARPPSALRSVPMAAGESQSHASGKVVVVIENGIELDGLLQIRRRLKSAHEPVVICFVGRLHYQKGLDVLLRAVGLLSDSTSDSEKSGDSPRRRKVRQGVSVYSSRSSRLGGSIRPAPREGISCTPHLWLAGEGPEREALEAQAKQPGVEPLVEFKGHCADVPALLAESDVFVLPSRYEGMSMALLEAMASGLPCVVSDVGENARLITQGQEGLVVPPEDAAALASAIRQLICNPELRYRMGQAARRKASSYSARRMAERTYEVYESVLRQRRYNRGQAAGP